MKYVALLIVGLFFLVTGVTCLILGSMSLKRSSDDYSQAAGDVTSVTEKDGQYHVEVIVGRFGDDPQNYTFVSTQPHNLGDNVIIFYQDSISTGTIDQPPTRSTPIPMSSASTVLVLGILMFLVGSVFTCIYAYKHNKHEPVIDTTGSQWTASGPTDTG